MTARFRLLLVGAGLGSVVTGVPVLAVTGPEVEALASAERSAPAVALLQDAARAARSSTWSGTQHIVSTRSGEARFTVLELHHTPGTGSSVRLLSSSDRAVAPDLLDDVQLDLLAGHYDLALAGGSACAGRSAQVVEARRPGRQGPAAVAGRFWVDRDSGLVLRRDVLDEGGAVVRSSAFVRMDVTPSRTALQIASSTPQPPPRSGEHLDDDALTALAGRGWPVVRRLPRGMDLFASRLHDTRGAEVLQMSYSDGLSTLSLFVQKGELPAGTGGVARDLGGADVRVSRSALEHVVWSGGGWSWTLVSDAPRTVVEQAVVMLPHSPTAPTGDGIGQRAWRGLSRVGGWLNPFR